MIEKNYKKHKFPGPDQYNTSNVHKLSTFRKAIENKLSKADRIGYLHEIEWKSKMTPGFYEKQKAFKHVEEKSKAYSFRKL